MITVLNPDKFIRDNKVEGPITTPQLFLGKSKTFHPNGLFSEEFFGIEGSLERRKNFSWINLNCQVIHPVFFDAIAKRIEQKFPRMLSGDKTFDIGEDGTLIENEMGTGIINGYTTLTQNIHKIKFRQDKDEITDRNKFINVLYSNIEKGLFFMDKLIVISPDFRPVTILEETGETRVDPVNEIYQRILIIANQLLSVSGALYDILTYKIQLQLRELHDLVRVKVSKKQGMIRKLMLGKRVDFSARSVITPNADLKIGEIGLPLRIITQIFEPNMIYALINSPESRFITDDFHQSIKEFLGKEKLMDVEF